MHLLQDQTIFRDWAGNNWSYLELKNNWLYLGLKKRRFLTNGRYVGWYACVSSRLIYCANIHWKFPVLARVVQCPWYKTDAERKVPSLPNSLHCVERNSLQMITVFSRLDQWRKANKGWIRIKARFYLPATRPDDDGAFLQIFWSSSIQHTNTHTHPNIAQNWLEYTYTYTTHIYTHSNTYTRVYAC